MTKISGKVIYGVIIAVMAMSFAGSMGFADVTQQWLLGMPYDDGEIVMFQNHEYICVDGHISNAKNHPGLTERYWMTYVEGQTYDNIIVKHNSEDRSMILYDQDDISVEYTITSIDDYSYEAIISIDNDSDTIDIGAWEMGFDFENGEDLYLAEDCSYTQENTHIVITPSQGTEQIKADDFECMSFMITTEAVIQRRDFKMPTSFAFTYKTLGELEENAEAEKERIEKELSEKKKDKDKDKRLTEHVLYAKDGIYVLYDVMDIDLDGYGAVITIENHTDRTINFWKLRLDFPSRETVKATDVESCTFNNQNGRIYIEPEEDVLVIEDGEKVEIGIELDTVNFVLPMNIDVRRRFLE